METYLDQVRALSSRIELVETQWEQDMYSAYGRVVVVLRRPGWQHPTFTQHGLVPLVDVDEGRRLGEAIAGKLGVPFRYVAEKGRTFIDEQPLEERAWTLRWEGVALHCDHDSTRRPVTMSGEVTIRAMRPGHALSEAHEFALELLPQGNEWHREAAARMVIDGVELNKGRVSALPDGDAPL